MSPRLRTVLATACAVAALGAAPHADAATHAARHGHGHGHESHHAGQEHQHGGQSVTRHQRQVLREISRLDARLARQATGARVRGLDDAEVGALAANVAADRADLATLTATAQSASTPADVRAVRTSLRKLRPEQYAVAVSDLRQADRLTTRVAADAAALAAVTDRDVSAGVAADDTAAAALQDAVTQALTVRAGSPVSVLRAVRADLVTARKALAEVADVLGDTGSED